MSTKDANTSDTPQRYLLVDDDEVWRHTLSRALRRRGHECYDAEGLAAALDILKREAVDRAIVDLKMDGESGLDAIEPIQQACPACEILILTGYSSIATTVEAIKRGAVNYLCKPAGVDDILKAFDGDADSDIPEQPHSVERLEWEHIQKVLAEHEGNVSATARALGMHRRTLQRKLQKKPVSR